MSDEDFGEIEGFIFSGVLIFPPSIQITETLLNSVIGKEVSLDYADGRIIVGHITQSSIFNEDGNHGIVFVSRSVKEKYHFSVSMKNLMNEKENDSPS